MLPCKLPVSVLATVLYLSTGVAAANNCPPPSDPPATPTAWGGPAEGPRAIATPVSIAMILSDPGNTGVAAVAENVRHAAQEIGWNLRVYSGKGSFAGQRSALTHAMASKPRALIINGFNAADHSAALVPARERGIIIAGWHAAAQQGGLKDQNLDINITSDYRDVACAATSLIGRHDDMENAGVVIFTDSSFKIATAKSEVMRAEVIRRGGTVLAYLDVPISTAYFLVPRLTRKLLARHGKQWTHALAINDVYFDFMLNAQDPNITSGQHFPLLISAGDGSEAAINRIRKGSPQVGTVAEPLKLQAWQIIDEINRLLQGSKLSGYLAPVGVITPNSPSKFLDNTFLFDSPEDYRGRFRSIWAGSSGVQ